MPIEAVSNGIDLRLFTPKKVESSFFDKFHLPKDKKIIMNIGRVDAEKHISTLILAFKESLKNNKDSVLVIVGDGTDMTNLQNLTYQLDISDKVYFMGTQNW